MAIRHTGWGPEHRFAVVTDGAVRWPAAAEAKMPAQLLQDLAGVLSRKNTIV